MLGAIGHLIESIDSDLISCITTADTSKAFDSVKHARLLEKNRLVWHMLWYGIWYGIWHMIGSRTGLLVAPLRMSPME